MVPFPFKRSLVGLAACLLLGGGLTSTATSAGAAVLPGRIEVSPRLGSATDSVFTPAGPALVLDGGELEVDAEFAWMRSALSADKTSRLGDVVVLTAEGNSGLDSDIYKVAPFNSVQTINLPPPSTRGDLVQAASIIDKAEAVFFDGGSQHAYVKWAGSPLMAAVQRVYRRGGVVGGSSAGLAILGQYVFDSSHHTVASSEALANPYSPKVTFTRNMLHFPPLAGWITDTHFAERNRFGRLTAFMARQIADDAVSDDPPEIYGVGIDEVAAVVVDKTGKARLLQSPAHRGAAYFLVGGPATQVEAGKPLIYPDIHVTRLDAPGQYYDLTERCGTGPEYTLSVDARRADPFGGVNPYSARGVAGTCSRDGDEE
jgi:cyanophycinase